MHGKDNPSDIPILEAVEVAIIITDAAGIVTYWNPFAEKLYGWPPKEVIGHSIMGITVTTETAQEAAQHMASMKAGNSWSGEFAVRCKNGELLPALVTLSPLFDDRGATIGIVGVSQDLRARRQVEDELYRARAELEKRVEERTEELRKANDSLRDLSARLLQIRDQEGRRLARELHDSVGQLLVAIGMNIAVVQSQSAKLDEAGARAVAENEVLVQQISNEIRTISHLLHPPMLDEVGLVSALRWYIEGFRTRSAITVEMHVSPDLGRLSAEKETAIFRIIQECLTNIHRHSGSNAAVIRITKQGEYIVVAAEDSGRGIPPDRLHRIRAGQSGVGFRGMAERIRHLGGDLEIRSTTTGTVVTATFPLEARSLQLDKEI
jgi:PAS domain S-box-containing protein